MSGTGNPVLVSIIIVVEWTGTVVVIVGEAMVGVMMVAA